MQNRQLYKINQGISDTISALRFPLAVLVVCIHAPLNAWDIFPEYKAMHNILVENVARTAVPMFFIISGFLFFHKLSAFDVSVYFNKLKSRFRTLFVPHCLWNLIVLFMFVAIQRFSPQSVPESMGNFAEYKVIDWLRTLWDANDGFPVNYPLWYLRDLIILVLSTPLVFLLIKRAHYVSLLLLAAGLLYVDVGSSSLLGSFVYFGIGAYIGIHKTNTFDIVVNNTSISATIYIILLALNLITHNSYLHRVEILAGICAMTGLFKHLRQKECFRRIFSLERYSFCIFVAHMPLLILVKFVAKRLAVSNALTAIFGYFTIVTLCVLASILIYKVMSKHFKALASLMLGKTS